MTVSCFVFSYLILSCFVMSSSPSLVAKMPGLADRTDPDPFLEEVRGPGLVSGWFAFDFT